MIWTVFTGTLNTLSGLISLASSGGVFMVVTASIVQMSSVSVTSMMCWSWVYELKYPCCGLPILPAQLFTEQIGLRVNKLKTLD